MARLTNLTERGLVTQLQLRDVLMSLIIEKGYERISIKDITERAGIDRTTFYLHFKDKDNLFQKAQRGIVDELMEMREQAEGPFPGITVVFEHMAANKELYRALFLTEGLSVGDAAGEDSSKQTIQDYVVQSMSPILRGLLREHGIHATPAELIPVAHFLAGSLRGLSRWWLESGMAKSPAEMSGLFLRLASNGLEALRF